MNQTKKIPGTIGALKRHSQLLLPRVTPIRLINLSIMGLEILFRRTSLISKPAIAKIESSSACNLSCKGCRTGRPLMEYKKGNLSIQDFEIMLDKMGKYLFEIVFYLWGEPLINKNLPLLIDMAHKKNIAVIISTNLHFLTEDIGRELLKYKLDKMIFCLDGWSQESYGKIRIGGDFEKAKDNIERFIGLRQEANSKKPFIEWQYIVTDENKSEVHLAQKAGQQLGVDRFVELADWCARLKNDDKYFSGISNAREKLRSRTNWCFWLWFAIAVQFDGNVFPCCHVANKPHDNRIYGNIIKDDLTSVWNSDKYRQSRLFLKSKCSSTDGDFICKDCFSPPIFMEPAHTPFESKTQKPEAIYHEVVGRR